jgi:signal-transduction protein with cAMP-binding, CBS, and nucleotidyltransferase domain
MVLLAKDIVEKDFLSLPRVTSALEAAKQMKSSNRGFVIIVDADGRPEGIVTEWDYLSKIVAEGRDPLKTTLEDIMSTDLVTVKASDDIDFVSQMMSERGIRRTLVIQGGKIFGVITAKTVLSRLKEYVDGVSSEIARLQSPSIGH